MVDVVEIPRSFDPFTDVELGGGGKGLYIHIRVQQRRGKKSLTTVQGLPEELNYERILKEVKKKFCCNGNIVQHKEFGNVIQLQGDQRQNIQSFLLNGKFGITEDQIKVHGF